MPQATRFLKVVGIEPYERGYPPIAKSWQRNRDGFIRLFGYPTEIRRIIYITNAIESFNIGLRKIRLIS
jgi:putative transposase